MKMEKDYLWELSFDLKQSASTTGPTALKGSPESVGMKIAFAPQQLSEVEHILEIIKTFQNPNLNSKLPGPCLSQEAT